jgi:hypothetical protein
VSSRTSPAISSELVLPDARRISARRRAISSSVWNGEVVVGAGVEPGDLVRPAIARGQHQHRKGAPFLAPHAEHGEAVDLRQAKIENHGIVVLGRAEEVAVLPVGGQVDGIAGLLQRRFELPAEGGFILDDQDAHGLWFPLG